MTNEIHKWCFDFIDPGLYVYEIGCEVVHNGKIIGPRIKDGYAIHFVSSGEGYFNHEPIHAGMGFLICPNEPHYFKTVPLLEWQHFWISFNGTKEHLENFFNKIGITVQNQCLFFNSPEELTKTLSSIYSQYDTSHQKPFLLLSILYTMAEKIQGDSSLKKRIKTPQEIYVDKAVAYMNSNYEKKISLDDVAHHIGITEKYMYKLFKSIIGVSPQEKLIRIRIDAAEELLRNYDLPVSSIAMLVGYDNPLDFSQIYKKKRGITPMQYRRINRSSV